MICARSLLRRLLTSERAQSAVELALALPFLTWVLLGTIDFARVFYLQTAVINAANTGAQFALDSRRSADEVRSIIAQEAAPMITIHPTNHITLTATPSWAPGNQLQVEVTQQFSAITPFINAIWGGGSLPVKAVTVVRFNPW
jgi:Flp pilus assembly protein TadG